ncbi:hypothetical protein PIB30_033004 [Stylosanthes scabra]|uniref:Uncharacterized protein n=1 Tax=Stylosanthes scabra TaxID=79078 RepID=A0ABU6UE70_9FABA|nr:hypothetical protein [Stylosanthes scabra]
MWFKSVTENTEDGLEMIQTDKDALELAKIGLGDDIVEVYVVQKSDFWRNSCIIEEIEVEEVDGPCNGGVGLAGFGYHWPKEGKRPQATCPIVGKGISHKGSSSELEEDSDLPWSNTKSEDSAHNIAFDDNDDDVNVYGWFYDVEVKSIAEEENVLPEQHGQPTPTFKKGKEVAMDGF